MTPVTYSKGTAATVQECAVSALRKDLDEAAGGWRVLRGVREGERREDDAERHDERREEGRPDARSHGRYGMGSTARPFTIVMKWTCGPVVQPVIPM